MAAAALAGEDPLLSFYVGVEVVSYLSLPGGPKLSHHPTVQCDFDHYRKWESRAGKPSKDNDSQVTWAGGGVEYFVYQTRRGVVMANKQLVLDIHYRAGLLRKDTPVGTCRVSFYDIATGPRKIVGLVYDESARPGDVAAAARNGPPRGELTLNVVMTQVEPISLSLSSVVLNLERRLNTGESLLLETSMTLPEDSARAPIVAAAAAAAAAAASAAPSTKSGAKASSPLLPAPAAPAAAPPVVISSELVDAPAAADSDTDAFQLREPSRVVDLVLAKAGGSLLDSVLPNGVWLRVRSGGRGGRVLGEVVLPLACLLARRHPVERASAANTTLRCAFDAPLFLAGSGGGALELCGTIAGDCTLRQCPIYAQMVGGQCRVDGRFPTPTISGGARVLVDGACRWLRPPRAELAGDVGTPMLLCAATDGDAVVVDPALLQARAAPAAAAAAAGSDQPLPSLSFGAYWVTATSGCWGQRSPAAEDADRQQQQRRHSRASSALPPTLAAADPACARSVSAQPLSTSASTASASVATAAAAADGCGDAARHAHAVSLPAADASTAAAASAAAAPASPSRDDEFEGSAGALRVRRESTSSSREGAQGGPDSNLATAAATAAALIARASSRSPAHSVSPAANTSDSRRSSATAVHSEIQRVPPVDDAVAMAQETEVRLLQALRIAAVASSPPLVSASPRGGSTSGVDVTIASRSSPAQLVPPPPRYAAEFVAAEPEPSVPSARGGSGGGGGSSPSSLPRYAAEFVDSDPASTDSGGGSGSSSGVAHSRQNTRSPLARGAATAQQQPIGGDVDPSLPVVLPPTAASAAVQAAAYYQPQAAAGYQPQQPLPQPPTAGYQPYQPQVPQPQSQPMNQPSYQPQQPQPRARPIVHLPWFWARKVNERGRVFFMNHVQHSTVWALPTERHYTVTFTTPLGVPLGLQFQQEVVASYAHQPASSQPAAPAVGAIKVIAVDPAGPAGSDKRIRPFHHIVSVNGTLAASDFDAAVHVMSSVRPLSMLLEDPFAVEAGVAAAAADASVEVVTESASAGGTASASGAAPVAAAPSLGNPFVGLASASHHLQQQQSAQPPQQQQQQQQLLQQQFRPQPLTGYPQGGGGGPQMAAGGGGGGYAQRSDVSGGGGYYAPQQPTPHQMYIAPPAGTAYPPIAAAAYAQQDGQQFDGAPASTPPAGSGYHVGSGYVQQQQYPYQQQPPFQGAPPAGYYGRP